MGGSLVGIDYIVLIVYLAGVLGIGAYFGRYVRSAGDLFLAGKALPFWAVGMSIVVSDIGAMDMVSGAGAAYEHGIAQANFDWIGSMPAMVIAAFVFVPYYWRSGAYTIPEFLGRRFGAPVQLLQAVIWLLFLVAALAVMLWTSAKFLGTQLGWSAHVSVWVTVAFVGAYTVSGGLAAVVMTDVLQMVVLFVGAAALLALCLWEVGGWDRMVELVRAESFGGQDPFTLLLPHDAPTPYPWSGIVFGLGLVLSTAYFVGNQAVVQRVLGARSEWDAKAGMLLAGFLKLFIPILILVPGIAARALHPDLEDADTAVPVLIRDLLPPGLTGLMFAAFLAALMSSVDSYLNSAVTVLLTDIRGPFRRARSPDANSVRAELFLGRGLTVALIVCAGLFAPILEQSGKGIYVTVQTMLSLFQGPTLAILLLGIVWRRANGPGALCGLLVGLAFTCVLNLIGDQVFPSEDPFLFVSFWSFVISFVVTVVVSRLTPPPPVERTRGLVMGDVLNDEEAQRLLQRRLAGR